MKKLAVVAIGYNRLDSLKRLLAALERAEYFNKEITLIISLDYYPDECLRAYAERFIWSHGEKILKFFYEKQGLRSHVLQCGNYLNDYDLDAIAVFEDDILPSKAFYSFMEKAVEFYGEKDQIAGIGLYSYAINPLSGQDFCPAMNGFDTYFMKFPCSWGQIWTRNQWNDFYSWYKKNEDLDVKWDCVPETVSNWPASSWLKYYVKYCIEHDKYFVYPYDAYTTNFNEAGTHVKKENNFYQVVLQDEIKNNYEFCNLDNKVKYDVYFERIGLGKIFGIAEEELCVDIYGNKPIHMGRKYWCTTARADFKMISSFANDMRPQEQNIIYGIKGEKIFLYDTSIGSDKCINDLKDVQSFIKNKNYNKKLVLYGCGRIGRAWLDLLGKDRVYCFADSNRAGQYVDGLQVLGIEELKKIKNEIDIYIATAYETKKEIHCFLKEHGMEKNIIMTPRFQETVYLDQDIFFDALTKFEGRNALLKGVQLQNCKLGYGSYVSFHTNLIDTEIGKYTSIGPNVRIIRGQHPTRKFVSTHPIFYSTNQTIKKSYVVDDLFEEYRYTKKNCAVEIGSDVWIGDSVTIMEGVKIADGTVIAARANVVRDTEPFSIVGGNPAETIRYRFNNEQIDFLRRLQWWNKEEVWIGRHAKYFDDIEKLQEIIMKEEIESVL